MKELILLACVLCVIAVGYFGMERLGRFVVGHRHRAASVHGGWTVNMEKDGALQREMYPVDNHQTGKRVLVNSLLSVGILLGATLLGLLFYHIGFTDTNIIMVYILGVLLTSVVTSHQVYSLISSVASVFVFNYLFTVPRFSLMAYDTGYPITFLSMFLTAYITGTLAVRYKAQARQSAKIAHKTKILLDADRLLAKANGRAEILWATAEQLGKLLERTVVIFEHVDGELSSPRFFQIGNTIGSGCDLAVERAAAERLLYKNSAVGVGEQVSEDTRYRYYALEGNGTVYAIIGVDGKKGPLAAPANDILLAILGEAALALENEKNAREKEAAAVLAESEQLRVNLLRTISHDLRTPLTSISGNASNLMSNGDSFDEATKQQIYTDIYEDSMWLIDLVENLLYATRIEDGRMTLGTSPQLLSEIVDEAVHRIGRKASEHPITVTHEDDLLLVKADAKLMVQVVVNLIDNAVKYTPSGTPITITTNRWRDMAEIRIADLGPGISPKDQEQLFDKFYCGSQSAADKRRSLGLGLFLCKEIVQAHGGGIYVSDNEPHGAVFCFTLPIEEVPYYA